MTDFLHFIFPFAPETKERKLAREILTTLKGGEGSGNFGHAGRPGEIGGSASDNSSSSNISMGNINYVNRKPPKKFDKYDLQVTNSVRLAQLLPTADDKSNFYWRLRTGRMPIDLEWRIMTHLQASNIGDAIRLVNTGMDRADSPIFKTPGEDEARSIIENYLNQVNSKKEFIEEHS